MPLPNSAQTGALLVATGLTAAGLSLGVLGIGSNESSSTASDDSAVEPSESVELLALPPAAQPVLLAAAVDGDASVADARAEDQQPSQVAAGATLLVASDTAQDADENSSSGDGDDHESTEYESDTTTTNTPVPATQPATTSGTQAPSTTSTTVVAATNPATTFPASTEYLTYEFEGVATIIVAMHNGSALEFWSVTPAPGWVFRVDDDTASKVKIKFQPLDDGDEAEWELKVEDDGELELKQEH